MVLILHAWDGLVVAPMPFPESQGIRQAIGFPYSRFEIVELILDGLLKRLAFDSPIFRIRSGFSSEIPFLLQTSQIVLGGSVFDGEVFGHLFLC